jgi:hypothetical protein
MIPFCFATGSLASLLITHAIGPPEKFDKITASRLAVPAEKDLLGWISIWPAPKTIVSIVADKAGPGPLATTSGCNLF